MFKDAFSFFTEIGKVNYNIHYYTKIGFIILTLGILSLIFYMYQDTLDKSVFRDSYVWFYFIAFINFINIVAMYYFYHSRLEVRGLAGPPGQTGDKGDRGKFKNLFRK